MCIRDRSLAVRLEQASEAEKPGLGVALGTALESVPMLPPAHIARVATDVEGDPGVRRVALLVGLVQVRRKPRARKALETLAARDDDLSALASQALDGQLDQM